MSLDKKILVVKREFGKKGGLEKYAYRLLEALKDKNYSVTFLSNQNLSSELLDKDINHHFLPPSFWPGFIKLKRFDQFCVSWQKIHPFPIVLGLDRTTRQTHIRAGNGCHRAFLQSRLPSEGFFKHWLCKINPLHQNILQLEKKAFENKDLKKLITNSFMVKEEILQYYNVDPKKIQVVHNGVEWEEMQEAFDSWQAQKKRFEKKQKLNPEDFQFVFVGNGFLRKGLKPLLYALSLLKKEPFQLSVIGKDKKIDSFLSLTKKLGLSDKVSFFGYQKDPIPFYQMADCAVIPSYYDPFANVTLEALAMGLYVITSKHNGAKEILTKGNGTILEDLSSIPSIASSLQQTMQRKKTQASSNEIRQSVKHLDFSSQLDQFIHALFE